jgi:hypothetical protein
MASIPSETRFDLTVGDQSLLNKAITPSLSILPAVLHMDKVSGILDWRVQLDFILDRFHRCHNGGLGRPSIPGSAAWLEVCS